MKEFNNFVREMKDADTLEELESGADLFADGIERGYYSQRQSNEFNKIYWNKKNRLITDYVYRNNKNVGYLKLISIIKNAPVSIKDDMKN
jgi:hypothetical protein